MISFAKRLAVSTILSAAVPLCVFPASAQTVAPIAEAPRGTGTYADMVGLFDEFRAFRSKDPLAGELTSGPQAVGVADNSPAVIASRRSAIDGFLARLETMNVASWDRPRQVDYFVVRSQIDEYNFILNVTRPWERDPGYYVDRMLTVTFSELPLKGDALQIVRKQLRDIPLLVKAAKATLKDVPPDYADLALHNLSTSDGVGHGHPFRDVPPAGVVGWYDDFLGRVGKTQPALRRDVEAARAAVVDFRAWLQGQRPSLKGPAGVGAANFDWYLKHVKMVPYTSHDLLVLGNRELNRLWAMNALEQHRNRNTPEIVPVASVAEYDARVAEVDARIRKFLKDEAIITVPDDIGELNVNTPFIVRPQGPNFWEKIHYRDPSIDYWHATLPGHSFDGKMADRVTHPIRKWGHDGLRNEGWGTYLEEAAQRLGYFEDNPRARELIDYFGIFRAARVSGDVNLQLNRWTLSQTIENWLEWVPWLNADVARVDAEIYLRRPPGYGLGYTIGMIEMQKLVAESKHKLGDKFVLKDFNDRMMTIGRIPLSLIRWEMTGADDEITTFWKREPLPAR